MSSVEFADNYLLKAIAKGNTSNAECFSLAAMSQSRTPKARKDFDELTFQHPENNSLFSGHKISSGLRGEAISFGEFNSKLDRNGSSKVVSSSIGLNGGLAGSINQD